MYNSKSIILPWYQYLKFWHQLPPRFYLHLASSRWSLAGSFQWAAKLCLHLRRAWFARWKKMGGWLGSAKNGAQRRKNGTVGRWIHHKLLGFTIMDRHLSDQGAENVDWTRDKDVISHTRMRSSPPEILDESLRRLNNEHVKINMDQKSSSSVEIHTKIAWISGACDPHGSSSQHSQRTTAGAA